MKRILVSTFRTPGYAPNELITYLLTKRSQDYQTFVAQVPAKHERRFIPGFSHYSNMKSVAKQAVRISGTFDLAVGPDPAFVLGLKSLRETGIVEKVIYWRLDYYPKYRYMNKLYQGLEEEALKTADEIWSIADPELPHVRSSLSEHLHKVKYVPYLLHLNQVQDRVDPHTRSDIAMWMGPDLDSSRPFCEEATSKLGVDFITADYSIKKYRLSQEVLNNLLQQVKVGISIYRPEQNSPKYFCDASRIRRFLANGVPVITTNVAPTHTTIKEENCGVVCDFNTPSISVAIRYCLNSFEELSSNAYKAAERYTFENWFNEHSNIL